MNADERRCRRDRRCHQANHPATPKFLSAFIRVHPRQNPFAFGCNPAGLAHHPRPRRRTAPPAIRPSQGAPTLAPTAPFKPSRIDPLNREPAAKPTPTAPFKPFRTDPLNREPTANPAPTARFKPSRIDPMNREPTAQPGPTVPSKPSRTDPLNREPAVPPEPDILHPHQGRRHAAARPAAHPALHPAAAPRDPRFATARSPYRRGPIRPVAAPAPTAKCIGPPQRLRPENHLPVPRHPAHTTRPRPGAARATRQARSTRRRRRGRRCLPAWSVRPRRGERRARRCRPPRAASPATPCGRASRACPDSRCPNARASTPR